MVVDQNSGHCYHGLVSKTLPISEVKARLPELVTGVAEREEEVVVTRNGRPAAMLVNYDEYRRQRDTLDILSDPAMMRQIRQSRRFYAANAKGLSFEDVFGEPVAAKKSARGEWRPSSSISLLTSPTFSVTSPLTSSGQSRLPCAPSARIRRSAHRSSAI